MQMQEINFVELDAIRDTIKAVRDRQRKVYDTLPGKKTIARHIASTHVEFCDQLVQEIGKMRKITITFRQEEPLKNTDRIIERIREAFADKEG